MQSRLPTEVLEVVIDQASDNAMSLRNLSLTCITLLPRSRYRLFSGLVIRTVQQLDTSPEFLDSRSWLPPLVRKVTLSVAIPEDNDKHNIPLLDIVPIYLLTRLPNLRAWTIETEDYKSSANYMPSLAFHHSALRCYRIYGGHIQSLGLSNIIFNSKTDFRGLLSAFTSLNNLTCYNIGFRTRESGHPAVTADTVATNVRLLQISTLEICTSVSRWAIEYLFVCSGLKLKHLTLQLRAIDRRYDPLDHLEQSIKRLPPLSSLALIILPNRNNTPIEYSFNRLIHSATTILERVNRSCLKELRVEFKPDPLANLGGHLSGDSTALEACEQLETALLTFPNAAVLVHDPVHNRRAGRAELWSPIIRHAFRRLDDRGLFTFKFAPSKEESPDPPGHEDYVTCVVISHDSAWVVTSSSDRTIIVWDMVGGGIIRAWPTHQRSSICTLALSPDSRRLRVLSSGGGRTLTVWDIHSDAALKTAKLEGHTDRITSFAWSQDGAFIASASVDGTGRIWDGRTYQERSTFPAYPHICGGVESLQFSPDASYLAWRMNDRDCYIWGHLTGEQPKMLRPHPDHYHVHTTAFSFHHESRLIATAHRSQANDPEECLVRIWDATTATPIAFLAGHSSTVSTIRISFSPDGRSLFSMNDDMSMWVWDCATWSGKQTGVLRDAKYLPSDSDWWYVCGSDGKYVATGSAKGLVRLWRTSDGECVASFDEHDGFVNDKAFSPNSKFLVYGHKKGIVRIRSLSEFIGE